MSTRTRTPAATGKTTNLTKENDMGTDIGLDAGEQLAAQLGVKTAASVAADEERTERAERERQRDAETSARGPMIFTREHTPDIDTSETDMSGHDRSISLNNDFDIFALRDQLNAGAADLGNPLMKGFVETLDFMNEMVLVRVNPSSETDATRVIEVWNDGTPQRFIRDQWVVAKRKYVEVLARSIPYSVTTPEGVDGMGRMTRRLETHVGQRFPFEMRDRNPLGANWLNRLFMERT